MVNPGSDELSGLDLIGVREDVGGGGLRIACRGDAPRQIREILPHRRLVNAPGGPRMGMDVDQAGDDRLPGHVDDARAGGRRAGRRDTREAAVRHDDVTLLDQVVTLHGDDPAASQDDRATGHVAPHPDRHVHARGLVRRQLGERVYTGLAHGVGLSFVACLSESARTESVRALSLASESARDGAYRKKLRPMDQCTVRPSLPQPMKSPPMRVSRCTGNGAAEVSDTLMAGGVAPTSGSVTRYT